MDLFEAIQIIPCHFPPAWFVFEINYILDVSSFDMGEPWLRWIRILIIIQINIHVGTVSKDTKKTNWKTTALLS